MDTLFVSALNKVRSLLETYRLVSRMRSLLRPVRSTKKINHMMAVLEGCIIEYAFHDIELDATHRKHVVLVARTACAEIAGMTEASKANIAHFALCPVSTLK
jgi:hypothetical protein